MFVYGGDYKNEIQFYNSFFFKLHLLKKHLSLKNILVLSYPPPP